MNTLWATLAVESRCSLGESIVWCPQRRVLYWTDIESRHLWRHSPSSGESHAWSLPERLGCLALAQDGRLLLGLAKGLHVVDAEAQLSQQVLPRQAMPEPALSPTLLARVEPDDPHTRINDGRADRHGNFVFGTKSEYADGRCAGRFYQYSARHGLRVLALPAAAIPNSICFDGSGRRMYFCDSIEPRIMRCDYDADNAAVSGAEVFVELDTPGASPDGSIIDAGDALWNAHWGAGRIVRYLPDGRVDRIVEVPTRQVSCCTLGGDALDTLYITTAREGLDASALEREPQAGSVFACPLGQAVGRREDRVRLEPGGLP